MTTNIGNILTQIQSDLGAPVQLVKNDGEIIVVRNANDRWFTALLTKTGKLKKNSVRVYTA